MAKRGNIIRAVTKNPDLFMSKVYDRKSRRYAHMALGAVGNRHNGYVNRVFGYGSDLPHRNLVKATLIKLGYKII